MQHNNTSIELQISPIPMPNLPIKQNLIEKLPNIQYNSRIHKHTNYNKKQQYLSSPNEAVKHNLPKSRHALIQVLKILIPF